MQNTCAGVLNIKVISITGWYRINTLHKKKKIWSHLLNKSLIKTSYLVEWKVHSTANLIRLLYSLYKTVVASKWNGAIFHFFLATFFYKPDWIKHRSRKSISYSTFLITATFVVPLMLKIKSKFLYFKIALNLEGFWFSSMGSRILRKISLISKILAKFYKKVLLEELISIEVVNQQSEDRFKNEKLYIFFSWCNIKRKRTLYQ